MIYKLLILISGIVVRNGKVFSVCISKQYQFDWFAGVCDYPTWVNGNESIRRNLCYGFKQESWGNMIYLGDTR